MICEILFSTQPCIQAIHMCDDLGFSEAGFGIGEYSDNQDSEKQDLTIRNFTDMDMTKWDSMN